MDTLDILDRLNSIRDEIRDELEIIQNRSGEDSLSEKDQAEYDALDDVDTKLDKVITGLEDFENDYQQ